MAIVVVLRSLCSNNIYFGSRVGEREGKVRREKRGIYISRPTHHDTLSAQLLVQNEGKSFENKQLRLQSFVYSELFTGV